HPWEDFAETWAHYFHMVDALETARSFGMSISPRAKGAKKLEAEVDFDPYRAWSSEDLVSAWVPFTVAVNSLNRSLGQADFYPFVLSVPVAQKLDFIHQLIGKADSRARKPS
ncbi:MAG: putative zinc-binding metallopeptidase, partial [Proteobacteria bacterium]|nr:putative zinc-binding metallopeptidase [Pseudomonadota bacterium]